MTMLPKQATLDLEAGDKDKDKDTKGEAERVPRLYIGCAGWSVSGSQQHRFPAAGSHLQRYAALLPAVEINSSFYRPHRPETYARWRDSVPAGFRFSVKLPRTITHQRRLRDADEELLVFSDAVVNLERKLGCLLVQLPPSLQYDDGTAPAFLERLRSLFPAGTADIACEPRHASWFTDEVSAMFAEWEIARVQADPAIVEQPPQPLYQEMIYIRLHGSPVMYRSSYSDEFLKILAGELLGHWRIGRRVWCVFDNTAQGAAMSNALAVLADTAGLMQPS